MTAPTDPMELLSLKKGWDSYDGDPPNRETVDMAAKLGYALSTVLDGDLFYVPCSDGSVQIEHHSHGWDIECMVVQFVPPATYRSDA